MEQKIVLATDIDGVLSHAFGLKCLDWLLRKRRLCRWLMDCRVLGKLLYRTRRTDKAMKTLLTNMTQAGHTVILISFVPERHRGEVIRWLKLSEIPFNELRLPFDGEEEIAFRTRAIPKDCFMYFDDDEKNVKKISLLVKAKIVGYQDKSIVLADL